MSQTFLKWEIHDYVFPVFHTLCFFAFWRLTKLAKKNLLSTVLFKEHNFLKERGMFMSSFLCLHDLLHILDQCGQLSNNFYIVTSTLILFVDNEKLSQHHDWQSNSSFNLFVLKISLNRNTNVPTMPPMYRQSYFRICLIHFENESSHVYIFMTRIPAITSFITFTRSSIHFIAFFLQN